MKYLLLLFFWVCTYSYADGRIVHMKKKNMGTYYVDVRVNNQTIEMLVDTGSSYTILDQTIIDSMHLKPIRHVGVVFANGKRQRLAVYRLPVLKVNSCVLHDIEVAGMTDNILGNTALIKMSPILMMLNKSEMVFNCT